MKKRNLFSGATAVVLLVTAGCAFNPESMPITARDNNVYVDPGAATSLDRKEHRFKVAVATSVGDYKDYKQVAEALDSSLNAKLANYAFFEMVDRKSAAALIKEKAATAEDPTEIDYKAVESDYIVVGRIASLNVTQGQPIVTKKNTLSGSITANAQFDFKWIELDSQKVIMTKSVSKSAFAQDAAGVVASLSAMAEEAAQEFCLAISSKYAPPARVLQTRGNGEAARISLGKNYGLTEDMEVTFFEIVDNSSVGGDKRDQNDVAKGTVKSVGEKSAWVRVHDFKNVNVRKGTYVRVLDQKKDAFNSMLEGTGVNGVLGR